MGNVYVVSFGEYSDRHVVAVCSDEAEAQRLADLTDSGFVSEFVLDEVQCRPADGEKCYDVSMRANGDVLFCQKKHHVSLSNAKHMPHWTAQAHDPAREHHRRMHRMIGVSTWAKSEEHAIKIANDFRLRALADNAWESLRESDVKLMAAAMEDSLAAGRDYPWTTEYVYD